MNHRQTRSAAVFRTVTRSSAAIALLMGWLTVCPEKSAAASEGRAGSSLHSSDDSGSLATEGFIGYRCQSQLFCPNVEPAPLVVARTDSPEHEDVTRSLFPVLSLKPAGSPSQTGTDAAAAVDETDSTDSQPLNHNQPSLTDLADTLQWTILLLAGSATVVIGVHRFSKQKHARKTTAQMEYQGSLPVRGQFSAHLISVSNRQFLVTTDRTGVKTVNALNEWDQFTAPVDLSPDDALFSDQLSQASADLKTNHHG